MTDFFKEMKVLVTELSENIDAVKTNVNRVQIEGRAAEKTGVALQKKIEEFKISAQPRIDKINELLSDIKEKTN
ncbi:hypothetical protein GHI93_01560 [Lactococcus hircilactis]|uniref:Uncharacterized protein n=1 Tax=Lactococcus hircilactis TaxID=1494462 RepID=A0A7X1Z6N9_9LACT|nr:hypothetical protein [Lactococcus hircilactis]MQW38636.1 hypothetical protein [Lactococcus hircilactis]